MKSRIKKQIYNTFVVAVLIAGAVWVSFKFIHLGKVEYTDNAQVKQLIIPANSRIQGFVSKICFNEYQVVKKGDTLAIIEDSEFRYRVAQAEANFQNAVAGKSAMQSSIVTTTNNISVSEAGIHEAKVLLENAEREYQRYANLLKQNAITRQQYDGVKTNFEAMKARYDLLVRQKQSTTLVKQEQKERLGQTDAAIKLAQAALDLAKLNLSYTVILAPCDGTTGRKSIQEGQLIQAGQTIVEVVDANDRWVIANYKETQTGNINEGMEVSIKVDAVPGILFKGHVESLSRATGASFSLLPQDNSAGNFVKVQQRIPVRIKFSTINRQQDMARLRAGMNVECEVKY